MLIQQIIQHPEMVPAILKNTPTWVWGLLAALMALGISQLRTRKVSTTRMMLTPVAMTGFSIYGTATAFGGSLLFGYVLVAWATAAAVVLSATAVLGAPRGAVYLPGERTFTVPGSWVPLALITGIFLTKYTVGVELAMQPGLAQDGQYTLVAGALYGAFSGAFAGRAARLWRMAVAGQGAVSPSSPSQALTA
jgi:hypothetical protein